MGETWSGFLDDFRSLAFSRREWKVFLILLAITFVAKGISVLPLVFASDDLVVTLDPTFNNPATLSQGRFANFLLREIHSALGVYPTYSNPLNGILSMASLAWAAVIVLRLWCIRDRILLPVLVGGVICTHPYTTYYFTFKVSLLYYSYILAFLALYLARPRLQNMLISIALFIFALGKNQLLLNSLSCVLLLGLTLHFIRSEDQESCGTKLRLASRAIDFWSRAMMISISVGLYWIWLWGFRSFNHLPLQGRTRLLPLERVPARFEQVSSLALRILNQAEPGFPLLTKRLLVAALLLGIALFVRRSWYARRSFNDVIVSVGFVFLCLFLAAVSVIGLLIPLQVWWPTARTLLTMGFFAGGVVAFAALQSHGFTRVLIIMLGSVLLFSYVGINNHILTDQVLVNLRDVHRANRILARLEEKADFGDVRKVIILGGFDYDLPGETSVEDYGSAFNKPWSRKPLLGLVSGEKFQVPTKRDRLFASEYCRNEEVWPHPDSIVIFDELAVICLPSSYFTAELRRDREHYAELKGKHTQGLPLGGGLLLDGVQWELESGTVTLFLILRAVRTPRPELGLRLVLLPLDESKQRIFKELTPVVPLTTLKPGEQLVLQQSLMVEPGKYLMRLSVVDRKSHKPIGSRAERRIAIRDVAKP